MGRARLTDSPEWALFRLDLRRHWRVGSIRRAAGILVAILALQGVVTYALFGSHFAPLAGVWPALAVIASSLGLLSSAWMLLAQGVTTFYPAMSVVDAVPAAASRFLMPAYAAAALAPDRESGRLNEIALTRLAPGRVLLAKGLASVLPLLVLAATGWVLSAAAFLVLPASLHAARPLPTAREVRTMVALSLILRPFTYLLTAGILVLVSALCRRRHTATAWCYLVQIVLIPGVGWILQIASGLLGPSPVWSRAIYQYPATVAILLVAFLLLLRSALRVLRQPANA